MTVKELIEYLSRVEDKNKEVIVEVYDYDKGACSCTCEIVYSLQELPDFLFISNDLKNLSEDKDRTIFSEKDEEKS